MVRTIACKMSRSQVACQALPDTAAVRFADVTRINPEQAGAAQDEGHDRGVECRAGGQADAGDRSALFHGADDPGQDLAAEVVDGARPERLVERPDARRIERRPEHDVCRAKPLQIIDFGFLAGQCGDLIAPRGQHVHRQTTDTAGRAGDDEWPLARLETVFFHPYDTQRGRKPGRTEGHGRMQ
jgi:hypothetical protein